MADSEGCPFFIVHWDVSNPLKTRFSKHELNIASGTIFTPSLPKAFMAKSKGPSMIKYIACKTYENSDFCKAGPLKFVVKDAPSFNTRVSRTHTIYNVGKIVRSRFKRFPYINKKMTKLLHEVDDEDYTFNIVLDRIPRRV